MPIRLYAPGDELFLDSPGTGRRTWRTKHATGWRNNPALAKEQLEQETYFLQGNVPRQLMRRGKSRPHQSASAPRALMWHSELRLRQSLDLVTVRPGSVERESSHLQKPDRLRRVRTGTWEIGCGAQRSRRPLHNAWALG